MTPTPAPSVHLVVPEGIDDPERASGGNVFDRHVRDGLSRLGWTVRMTPVDVESPSRDDAILARVPDGDLVLVDGLVAGRWPGAIEVEAQRVRIVVLAHMVSAAFPDADPAAVEGERRALRAARSVIATSTWTRSELVERGVVSADRIFVVTPGTDEASEATGTPTGGALLCVGVVAPHKGQDTLIEALAALDWDHPWSCTIAGSLAARPDFAARVERAAVEAGLGERVRMPGVLSGHDLDEAYRCTDLLVAPSRTESYGMAIADALGRGIPVVATDVGGIPQTVAASRAALLVPSGQPRALSEALRRWMMDPELRERLTGEARRGRSKLPRWSATADRIAETLAGVR